MIRIGDSEDAGGPGDRSLPTISRFAIVLEPTEIYLNWAKRSPEGDEEVTLEEIARDSTCYLIPEIDAEPDDWLRRNYAAMFEFELESWCQDEALWPQDRSFKTFGRFFRVRFHSIVIDMCTDAIVKDVG